MRQLPNELATLLKDKLRGARYMVRHGVRLGQDSVAFAPGMPDAACLAERLLAATKRTANALMLRERHDFEYSGTVLEAWKAMCSAANETQRKRLFMRIHYRLTEAVLRHMGAENVFISEHEIALAYETLRRTHLRIFSLWPTREARSADTVRFWVAAAVTLGARQPLREIDLPRQISLQTRYLQQAPTPFCLLIVALTGAILTTRPPAWGEHECAPVRHCNDDGLDGYIDSATAVVTARFDRFRAAFTRDTMLETGSRQARAIERLAEEFQLILPFLP